MTFLFPHWRKDTIWRGPHAIRPSAIVMHHSCGTYEGGIDWISNPIHKANVSYHVLIALNGERTQFCEWHERAWHAGKSEWEGRGDLNSWSIGISWELNTYHRKLTDPELASAAEIVKYLMARYNIPKTRILSHRQVSPGRKDDPSPAAMEALLEAL